MKFGAGHAIPAVEFDRHPRGTDDVNAVVIRFTFDDEYTTDAQRNQNKLNSR